MALYPLLRPLIFRLDAERAHELTIAGLKTLPSTLRTSLPKGLATEVAGLRLPSPIGLAAGFDKDAEVFDAMSMAYHQLQPVRVNWEGSVVLRSSRQGLALLRMALATGQAQSGASRADSMALSRSRNMAPATAAGRLGSASATYKSSLPVAARARRRSVNQMATSDSS